MHQRWICRLVLQTHQRISNFPKPTTSNLQPTLSNPTPPRRRAFNSSSGGEFDQNKEVDTINLKFAEAREEIEMAMESKETVYFDEEAECARNAVNDVLESYAALLAKLPEDKKGVVQRSMGLKIEQLKAEIEQLNE